MSCLTRTLLTPPPITAVCTDHANGAAAVFMYRNGGVHHFLWLSLFAFGVCSFVFTNPFCSFGFVVFVFVCPLRALSRFAIFKQYIVFYCRSISFSCCIGASILSFYCSSVVYVVVSSDSPSPLFFVCFCLFVCVCVCVGLNWSCHYIPAAQSIVYQPFHSTCNVVSSVF